MDFEMLLQLLNDPAWDSPFFKRLANNDTAHAPGHQGGIVIPTRLRPYFPTLDVGVVNEAAPTVDRYLQADMMLAGQPLRTDVVRYQYQTWGGARTPESRLTSNLGPVRNEAHGGDLLIMQRSREQLDRYRLVLVRQQDEAFERLNALTGGQHCGPLFEDRHPMSQEDLVAARAEMLVEAQQPFVPLGHVARRQPNTRAAIARDTAFRETILRLYTARCCVSRISLATPTQFREVEAAHVIPLSRGGADEPRNGMSLTSTLHWAFDRGLFGIDAHRRVVVPARVLAMAENAFLVQFNNQQIAESTDPHLRVAPEALAWHLNNVTNEWS
jgi:putative restriction endonuclease